MKILFDNGVPWALRKSLPDHEITSAHRLGWHELRNGELIQRAEEEGFDLFLTNDKNIRYQQKLTNRKIAIVVLTNPQWPQVQLCLKEIAAAVRSSQPGDFLEVIIPYA